MDVLENATTGFLQWAPPPENDSLISSLTYLTLTITTALLFAILLCKYQRKLRNHHQRANMLQIGNELLIYLVAH